MAGVECLSRASHATTECKIEGRGMRGNLHVIPSSGAGRAAGPARLPDTGVETLSCSFSMGRGELASRELSTGELGHHFGSAHPAAASAIGAGTAPSAKPAAPQQRLLRSTLFESSCASIGALRDLMSVSPVPLRGRRRADHVAQDGKAS
jgi:hypothetical protein